MKKKQLQNLFIVYFSILPIFSLYFMHNRIATLIELLIAIALAILTIIYIKEARSKIYIPISYLCIVLIYLFINYYRSYNFTSLVPGNFNYNVIDESLTIIKLITPVMLLYFLYYINFNLKQYFLIINIWTIFITSNIIFTNILKLSLCSYNSNTISYSIFEWNNNLNYLETASKGFFTYANQQAAMLVLLLPLIFYKFIENWKYIFLISALLISGLMMGTRVSSLGLILVLFCLIIIYIIFTIIKQHKFQYHIIISLIPLTLSILILPISPYNNRNNEFVNENNEIEISYLTKRNLNQTENIEGNNDKKYKIKYFNTKVNNYYLPEIFYEKYYPIIYDTDFWYNFIKDTPLNKINYRYIEKSIIKRVKEINDNNYDKLFGISNTRIQNIVNIEQDFILHYFAFGIIGMLILLIQYFIIIPYEIHNFLKYKIFFRITLLSSITLFVFVSILTGNIINSLNIIIPFSLVLSMTYNKNIDKNNTNLL